MRRQCEFLQLPFCNLATLSINSLVKISFNLESGGNDGRDRSLRKPSPNGFHRPATSLLGTFETCRRTLTMSARRGAPEVVGVNPS
jgi:hypothetical protein